MFTEATRSLASLSWPTAVKFSDEITENFGVLTEVYPKLVGFLWSDSGFSVVSFLLYCVGTFLAITAPAWMLLYFNRRKKIENSFLRTDVFEAEVNGESSERIIDGPMTGDGEVSRARDAAYVTELTIDDTEYAEDIQFHEALLASIITTEMTPNSPSSSIQGPLFSKRPDTFVNGLDDSSESFCEICLENKENWQMFTNDKCPHSFCYDCTSSHIIAKIQDKAKEIPCPELHCKAALNFNVCRLMIPDDTLIQWDELLCMSLIPESQKLYCPFRDCSTMLVNDSGQIIRETKCVACKRSFCAECSVPWHPDFTCKEFQKLYAKTGGGKVDKIVKTLAKKKKWQKCPKCKMFVEKTGGCVHITCRCNYEFCYRCGSKWSDSHGNCRPNL